MPLVFRSKSLVCFSQKSTLGQSLRASLVAQTVKKLLVMQETQVWSLGQEDPLEKGWLPTAVLLPGEFHGQRSLAGYSPWGCKETDPTEWLTLSLSLWANWCSFCPLVISGFAYFHPHFADLQTEVQKSEPKGTSVSDTALITAYSQFQWSCLWWSGPFNQKREILLPQEAEKKSTRKISKEIDGIKTITF